MTGRKIGIWYLVLVKLLGRVLVSRLRAVKWCVRQPYRKTVSDKQRWTSTSLLTLGNFLGSTLDIWRMVIPVQMTKKARTTVMIVLADAFKPW